MRETNGDLINKCEGLADIFFSAKRRTSSESGATLWNLPNFTKQGARGEMKRSSCFPAP